MTPKQKAAELILMYMAIVVKQDIAKKCALAAADEIIKSNPIFPISFNPHPTKRGAEQYWEEVKNEIENI
jgi:hypothetical protein